MRPSMTHFSRADEPETGRTETAARDLSLWQTQGLNAPASLCNSPASWPAPQAQADWTARHHASTEPPPFRSSSRSTPPGLQPVMQLAVQK